MDPIITIHNPLPEIALIEISGPLLRDDQTVSFYIKMDRFCFMLELKEDGHWRSKGFNKKWDAKVLLLIEEKIGQHYANYLINSSKKNFKQLPDSSNFRKVS